MESRRRSSRSVAEKHDPKDLKANGGFGSTGQVGTSSDDENEDDVSAPHNCHPNPHSAANLTDNASHVLFRLRRHHALPSAPLHGDSITALTSLD